MTGQSRPTTQHKYKLGNRDDCTTKPRVGAGDSPAHLKADAPNTDVLPQVRGCFSKCRSLLLNGTSLIL